MVNTPADGCGRDEGGKASLEPVLEDLPTDVVRVEVLRDLLARNAEELKFWKDRNWAAMKLSVAAILALSGAVVLKGVGGAAWGVAGLIACICIMSHVYQAKNFRRHKGLVLARTRIQAALCCFRAGSYLEDAPLLDRPTARAQSTFLGSGLFQLAVYIVSVLAVVVVLASDQQGDQLARKADKAAPAER